MRDASPRLQLIYSIVALTAVSSCDRQDTPLAAVGRENGRDPTTDRSLVAAKALDAKVEALWSSGQGDGAEILAVAEEAVTVKRKLGNAAELELSTSLVNLATLLFSRGRFEEAKPHFDTALDTLSRYQENHSGNLANCLNGYGGLNHKLGDYRHARELFKRALDIERRAGLPDDSAICSTLINLAAVLTDMGKKDAARRRFEEAAAILSKPGHSDAIGKASGMNNFAWLLYDLGDTERAADLFRAAFSIREKALGPKHPHVAWSLSNLGVVHLDSGNAERAKACFDKALSIRLETFGPENSLVAHSLRALALLQFRSGAYQTAIERALEAESTSLMHMELQIRALNEQLALQYASSRFKGLDIALSALTATTSRKQPNPESTSRVWPAVIRSRAAVLDEMATHRRSGRSLSEAGDASELRVELQRAVRELANLAAAGPGGKSVDAHRGELAAARQRAARCEEALARRSVGFSATTTRRRATLNDVRSALPPDWALVAYVRHDRYRAAGRGRVSPVGAYTAFVLADRHAEAVMVSLGEAKPIDEAVSTWRSELDKLLDLDPQDSHAHTKADDALRSVGFQLRDLVWSPIEKTLGQARSVFVVPDGAISRIPLAALPGDAPGVARFLLESGPLIHYLASERDLVVADSESGSGLLTIGGATFGDPTHSGTTDGASDTRPTDCPDLASIDFRELSGTLQEAQSVANSWRHAQTSKVTLLSGTAADEANFKRLAPGHRVIHLATHGFFLDGTCSTTSMATRGIALSPLAQPRPAVSASEDPLLLSGLELAGANTRSAGSPRDEDGILTAAEVASIDLTGVEWAVLSACDTGRGRVQAGEGVLGLRRAFQIAGARAS